MKIFLFWSTLILQNYKTAPLSILALDKTLHMWNTHYLFVTYLTQ